MVDYGGMTPAQVAAVDQMGAAFREGTRVLGEALARSAKRVPMLCDPCRLEQRPGLAMWLWVSPHGKTVPLCDRCKEAWLTASGDDPAMRPVSLEPINGR